MFVKIHFDNNGLHIEDLDESSSDSSDSDSSSDGGNIPPGDLPREPPRPPDAPRPPPRAPPNQPGRGHPIDPDPRIPPAGPPPNQPAEMRRQLREAINQEGLQALLGSDDEPADLLGDPLDDLSDDSLNSFHTPYNSDSSDEDNQPKPPRRAQPVMAVKAVQTRHKEPLYEPQPVTINNNAAPINIQGPAINVQPPMVNVEGARLNVEAPRVNVEAPRINVEAPNIQVNVPAPQVLVNVPAPQVIRQELNVEQILIAIREELNANLHLPYSSNPRDNLLMEEENRRGPPPNPGAAAVMERPAVLYEPNEVQQPANNTQPPAPPAPPAPVAQPEPVAQPQQAIDTGDIEAVFTAMEQEVAEDKAKGWPNWSDEPASISADAEPDSVVPPNSRRVNPEFNSDSLEAYLTSLDPDVDSKGNYTDASVERSGKKRRVQWKWYSQNAKTIHHLIGKTLRKRKQIGNTTSSGKYITKRGHENLKAIARGFWKRLRNTPVYTTEQLRPDGLPIDYDQRMFIIDMINLVTSLPDNSRTRLKENIYGQLHRILPDLFQ